MGTCASRIGLKADLGDLPTLAKTIKDRRGVELPMQRAEEATERRFDRVAASGESPLREVSRQHAALRRPAGVKALGHRAEPCRVEPGGLRGADAERVGEGAWRKVQRSRRCGCRTYGAGGAGHVVAAGRVANAGADADAKADFVSSRQCCEQPFPRPG